MKLHADDTIAAIATPHGEGAIAVVRVSGPEAIAITEVRFRGKQKLADAAGYTVHHGCLLDKSGELVDDVLVTLFRSPHSYTGEDSVEISCHGGPFGSMRVLEAVLGAGARHAEPGEFTKRAFLNGKMNLSQAEAVADLISARSQRAYAASLNQLQGRLGSKIGLLRSDILKLCSLVELELDFSEEGIDLVSKEEATSQIRSVVGTVDEMIGSFEMGRLFREGVSVAIVGQPNVGKSSLFNALLRESRAIVTDIPGTTRDSLEENIILSGVLFRLSDTAGMHSTPDIVEAEGILRAKRIIKNADIVLLVRDIVSGGSGLLVDDVISEISPTQKLIVVNNKTDLRQAEEGSIVGSHHDPSLYTEVYVSAKTGAGLDELRARLIGCVVRESDTGRSGDCVTSRRHVESLQKCRESLVRAGLLVRSGSSGELLSIEFREAANYLAEITGELTTEDVLNSIFQRFCVGK